jgi:hypothetical protein
MGESPARHEPSSPAPEGHIMATVSRGGRRTADRVLAIEAARPAAEIRSLLGDPEPAIEYGGVQPC